MKTNRILLVLLGLLACAHRATAADNWPQWRGPFFNGSTTETNLPDTWSKTENVLWAAPLPGPSHATPIIWDDSVFVNSPDDGQNLLLLCLDRHTGKVRWQKQVGVGDRTMGRNNMASPSPVTDGKTVWTMFGTGDLAAFDFSGKQLWARHLAKEYGRFSINWLYGSSPLLYKDRLYIEVLQRCPPPTDAPARQVANPSFSAWIRRPAQISGGMSARPMPFEESQEAYTTPMPCECAGRTEIVVAGGDYVTGQDAATGEELWRGGGLRNFQHLADARLVPSPLVADGLVFVVRAQAQSAPGLPRLRQGRHHDQRPGLDLHGIPDRLRRRRFFTRKNCSMLDGDRQMMVCLDPKTGEVQWQQPLGNREIYRASPTGADGKIYCLSENATAVVMSAADGQVLSTITMDEGDGCHATIAAAQGCLFVRTAHNLYCIGKK